MVRKIGPFFWGLLTVISLNAQSDPPGPWPRHTVDKTSSGADGVKLADVNRDGFPDVVTGWEEGGRTKLYLHPGQSGVRAPWPAVDLGATPDVEDAVFADLDGDGRPEVISCSEGETQQIYVHRGPKRQLLRAKKWKQQILPAAAKRMRWMYAEPLQVDGRYGLDLIAAGKGEGAGIGWFEVPKKGRNLENWQWHGISPVGWVMSIILRDMDADGDTDIIITDRYGDLQGCRWLENPDGPDRQKQPWLHHFIGGKGLEVMFMTMTDLNGDGAEEAIVAERTHETVRIFERTGSGGREWKERSINLPAFTGRAKSVEAGDINGDQIPDLVISTNTNGDGKHGLIWLDGNKISTARDADFQPISGVHNAKYDKVELLDLDSDGDLDILICEENYGPESEGLGVIWYENRLNEE